MTDAERIELAKAKTQRIVDLTIDLIRLHETNRIVVYSPQLAAQIPRSHAANAFNSFQRSLHAFALVRLCALWQTPRERDLDMYSVPAVARLIQPTSVLDLLQDIAYRQHLNAPTIYGLDGESPEVIAAIEQDERAATEWWARQQSRKIRAGLNNAISATRRLKASEKLIAIINHRDKYLAHSLAATRREKSTPVVPAKFGFERLLVWKTVAIVDRLHIGINGAGFSWHESIRIVRKNAHALWDGCTFKVLE